MARVLVSLGANRGPREASLAQAIRRLSAEGLVATRVSGVWETEPVGTDAGPDWFLNLAAVAGTDLGPREALDACLAVERAMGRVRDPAKPGGPRTIDVDLLSWENAVVDEAALTLPHPRLHQRRFVLAPLAEIAPEWVHPVLGRSVAQMLSDLPPGETVRRVGVLAGAV